MVPYKLVTTLRNMISAILICAVLLCSCDFRDPNESFIQIMLLREYGIYTIEIYPDGVMEALVVVPHYGVDSINGDVSWRKEAFYGILARERIEFSKDEYRKILMLIEELKKSREKALINEGSSTFSAAKIDGKSYISKNSRDNSALFELVVELIGFISEDFWKGHDPDQMEIVEPADKLQQ